MGEGEEAAALAAALRILTRRDHTEQELRAKLTHRGYPSMVADAVVQKLRDLSYLDDHRVATSLATSAVTRRGFFGPRLHLELARRGVPREMAAEVAADAMEEHDERHLLREVLQRRFPGFAGTAASGGELRRVVNYLQRRGFSIAAIMQVVRGRDEDW